ncbi:MAG: hypothetical protein H0W04_03345 [Chthoniobacterales bacterium]|nr:hypothetical protein [Chthoniobacterales bacterium]
MTRWSALMLNAMVAGSVHVAGETLSQEPEDPLEIEPPVLIQSRAADGTLVVQGAGPLPDPEVEIAKLEKELVRARSNANAGEHLYKSGVISKLEAESRALKVIQLEARLAGARLALAKLQSGQPDEADGVLRGVQTTSNLNITEASEAAQRAAEAKRRAELDAALRNLQRQQKLLALGSGRKADVNRAEQRLAELQRAQD